MFNYINISVFLAFFALNNIINFTPSFGNEYYVVMLLGLMLLIKDGKFRFSIYPVCLLFLLVSVISILANSIPASFNPWLRLLTFTVVWAVSGPLLAGETLDKSKITMFWTLRWSITLVAILSFLGKIIGVGTYHGHGYYCGLTVHSITMGLIAANSMVFVCYLYLTEFFSKKYKKWCLVAILFSITILFAAASRSAFLAGCGGALFMFFLLSKKNFFIIIRLMVILVVLLFASFPLWEKSFMHIKEKNGGITSLDISSREGHWKNMLYLFEKNPVIGIGFSYLSSNHTSSSIYQSYNGQIESGNGQIEPGNSWLVVLTMTGILGGFCIAYIMFVTFRHLKRQSKLYQKRTAFLSGLLFCEILHMCGEGYILAAGGFGFFNFWCLIGTIWAYSHQTDHMPQDDKIFGKQTNLPLLTKLLSVANE